VSTEYDLSADYCRMMIVLFRRHFRRILTSAGRMDKAIKSQVIFVVCIIQSTNQGSCSPMRTCPLLSCAIFIDLEHTKMS
jgi:hypothetical protein